nr:MAG TPA: hypothetical protein [Caudoviricetes sp.]
MGFWGFWEKVAQKSNIIGKSMFLDKMCDFG